MSKAPVKPIMKDKFLCIEYPGYIKNIDRALETLGGLDNIIKAPNTNSDLLPLNFRPNDPYSHPLFGDKVNTSSMILEIEKDEEGNNIDHQIIGVVPHTYRFRSIADFQWLPESMGEPNLDPKEQEDTLPKYTDDDPIHLLPPIFSATDLPLEYQYQSNPFFSMEEIINEDGKVKVEFISKSKKESEIEEPHVIDCEAKDVPTVSKVNVTSAEDKELVETLKRLFEERPIWCKNMLYVYIPDKDIPRLKYTLPVVAYHFVNGPWRKAWVRLGYDPRTTKESCIYQVIDFRVKKGETRGQSHSASGKFKINPRRFRKNVQEEIDKSVLKEELSFKKPPSQRQTMYQIGDIDIISDLASQVEDQYNKEYGWYNKKIMMMMRQRMKEKLKSLIAQWDENNMDIEDDNDDKDNNENRIERFLNDIVDRSDDEIDEFSDEEDE